MVRKLTLFVNHTFIYSVIFKGIMRYGHPGRKSGHPQVHKVGPRSLWYEVQVNKIEIDGGG